MLALDTILYLLNAVTLTIEQLLIFVVSSIIVVCRPSFSNLKCEKVETHARLIVNIVIFRAYCSAIVVNN